MLITYAFCVQDIDLVLKDKTGFPFISVFLHATGSVKATTAMTSLMLVLQACAAISNVATTSRQVYAFARDGGVPFAAFFAKVKIKLSIIKSIYVTHKFFFGRLTSDLWFP